MLNMKNYGNSGHLAQAASLSEVLLRVSPADAPKFSVPPGDHYYLTIREGSRREVVKVTRTEGTVLHAARAQDGTTGQSFSTRACIQVEWNPKQLTEYIGVVDPPSNNIAPGTYCLGCSTCIDVDSSGRITAINNAEDC